MIRATIFRKNGSYTGFSSEGHAGYADEGCDIICAAVSALMINCVNSIETIAGVRTVAEDRSGYLHCSFPEGINHEGIVLMDSMILGLGMIAETYGVSGESFLEVRFEED